MCCWLPEELEAGLAAAGFQQIEIASGGGCFGARPDRLVAVAVRCP